MTDDLDSVFGRKPNFTERFASAKAPPPEAPAPESAEVGYKAYGTLTNASLASMCDIGMWMDGTTIPVGSKFPYHLLMEIAYVGSEELRLYFPDKIVVIEGRHLNDLAEKLSRRLISSIQQFNASIWTRFPADRPIITYIKIVRSADGMGTGQKNSH